MARPTSENIRPFRVTVNISSEEKAIVEAAARGRGLSVAAFIRQAMLVFPATR